MGASYRPSSLEALEAKYGGGQPSDPLAALEAKYGASARPGVLTRAKDMVTGFGRELVDHPGATLASFVSTPLASLRDALLAEGAPNESEASVGYAGNRGGPVFVPRALGARNPDQSITPQRQREAVIQSAANLVLPGAAGKVASTIGRGVVGRTAALVTAGAAGGAAYSPDDPMAGALSGAAMAPAVAGLAKSAGATASRLLRPAQTKTLAINGREIASVEGRVPRAAREAIAERRAQDVATGAERNVPSHRALPPMALDEMGPAVQGYAEAIANRPGAGGVQIREALGARQRGMREAVSSELERGTGVTRDAGMNPLREQIAKAGAAMDEAYTAARAATEGQAVQSATLDAIATTPVGRAALEWGRLQKANRMQKLPRAEVDNATAVAGAGDDALTIERSTGASALDAPEFKSFPDPETLHYAKQYLANAARMGVRDGTGGTVAVQAQGALSVWGKIRAELPPQWRAADAVAAEHFRLVDAMNEGRNVYRTPSNPTGKPRGVVQKSLDALEQRQRAAPDAEAAARRTGAGMAAHERLRAADLSTRSPSRILARSEQTARQTRMGFADDAAFEDFQGALRAWDAANVQAQRITGGSQTARRGADGSGAGAVKPSALMDGPKAIARRMVDAVVGAKQLRNQQAVEAEVARMLTSPSMQTLPAQTRGTLIAGTIRRLAIDGPAQGAARLVAAPNARDDRR